MKRLIKLLVVVLLLPQLAACGGAATREMSRGADAKASADAKAPRQKAEKQRSPSTEEESSASSSSGAEDSPPDPASPKPAGTPEVNKESKNTMAIDVAMSPACVRRTERTTMTIKAEKFADLSYGVSYADGQAYDQYGVGRADAKGVYKKTFVVPLDAAVGEVTVLVAGINYKNSHGGSAKGKFRVASTSC